MSWVCVSSQIMRSLPNMPLLKEPISDGVETVPTFPQAIDMALLMELGRPVRTIHSSENSEEPFSISCSELAQKLNNSCSPGFLGKVGLVGIL